MAHLRRPLVPEGPIRAFFERLHALHEAAGRPSMRELQRRTRSEAQPKGINPTTIHDTFSKPRLARLDVVRPIVRELGGDVDEFAALWRQARIAETRVLAADTPLPERRAERVPAQLPLDMAGFTGRVRELARLNAILATAGNQPTAVVISALSGTAGVGKTALAVHWAHQVAGRFVDGQLYVNLRGFDPSGSVMSPAEAIRGFLDAFDVVPERIPVSLEAQAALYRSLLAGKRVLVVLDNAREAEQIRPLLPGSPGCLVLVTSRNELTGLVAAEGAHPLALDLLSPAEARDLLVRRLGHDRVLTEPDAVEEIIARCARLPLALAIVGARAATHPQFPLAALLAELREARTQLQALDSGDAVTNVRAVFSWSYHTLSPDAARLFQLLGLHPGPDVATPAAASLLGIPREQIRPLLGELTRIHLVTEHTPGRYTFHDLLRAYANDLAHSHDTATGKRAAIHRLLDHYLHTAQVADKLLYPQRDPVHLDPPHPGVMPENIGHYEHALTWFTSEHPVLLAAIRHAANVGFDTHTWQLAWALDTFLNRRGHWHDLAAVQNAALAAARRLNSPIGRAHAHRSLGFAYARLRNDATHYHLQRALDLFSQLGDLNSQANTHLNLGRVFDMHGHHEESLRHDRHALDLFRAAGNQAGQANALNSIGWCQALLGHHQQALTSCKQALALHQEIGDRYGQAETWDSLGYAHHHLGHHQQATDCYQQALDLFHELGDRYNQADTLTRLGHTHQTAGDRDTAHRIWRQALAILEELGHPDADHVRTKLQVEQPTETRDPTDPWDPDTE